MFKDYAIYVSRYAISLMLGILPFSLWYPLYKNLQFQIGGLAEWNPRKHLDSFFRAFPANASLEHAFAQDISFVELGTGGSLFHPLLAYLLGFRHVVTIDAVDLLDERLVRRSLQFILDHISEIKSLAHCSGFSTGRDFLLRLRHLEQASLSPDTSALSFIVRLIESHPANYADVLRVHVANLSKVYIFSVDVLEHVPVSFLRELASFAVEMGTNLCGTYHFVDISDHFAVGRVSRLAFLSLPNLLWKILSLNSYHYCNRLRPSDFVRLLGAQSDLKFYCEVNRSLCGLPLDSQSSTYDKSATALIIQSPLSV
jgi:hypothetical protein